MAAKINNLVVDRMENVNELADRCSICTEDFRDPVTLSCNHTYCRQCLRNYIQSFAADNNTSKSEIIRYPCPVCRQLVVTKEISGNEFEENQIMQALTSKITSPRRVNCDVCKYKKKEIQAKDHCPNCNISYCEQCKKDHDRHYLFRKHSVIPVTEIEKSVIHCEIHSAESVRYFCTKCTAPLCTVCAVTDHNNHDTNELVMALGNKKEILQEKIASMSDKVMHQEELLMQLEDLASVKEAAVKKTKAEIERHVAHLIDVIQCKRDDLLDALERNHTAGIKALNIEKENCQMQLANMKSLWKFAAKLMEPSQSIQLLAMYNDINKMVDGLGVGSSDLRPSRNVAVMSMFVPKESMLVGELQKCEISSDLMKRVSGLSHSASGVISPRASSPVPEVIYETANVQWKSPKLLWKNDKIGSKPGEINEVYDVAITPNGVVTVAEWLNQRLQIFDFTGVSRDVIAQGQIQPWGITLTRDGNFAITDEKDRTVKIYSQSGSCIQSWRKQIFGWPRGIVVNHAGQFIVTDTQHGKHTISIHLPDGHCIRQFGTQGSGNEQFHWPRYIAVDDQDRIIVSDSSNHCIKVLDQTGQFIFKFGSQGSADGQLRHPRGVAVEPNGGVLVADHDNNRITLFNRDGRFIRHLLAIHKPWSLSISEGGLLCVTHKMSVSLYKIFDLLP